MNRHAEIFKVGDEVWWHVPSVMAHCRTWAPDTLKPVSIVAVQDAKGVNLPHPQLVRVSPNYCPYGDEFSGSWFLPVGIRSHNDAAYRAIMSAKATTGAEPYSVGTERSGVDQTTLPQTEKGS